MTTIAPDASAPNGSKPHPKKRYMLLTRPSNASGIKRWRYDTVTTFHNSAANISKNSANATINTEGTSASSALLTAKPRSAQCKALRRPIKAAIFGQISPPTTPPAAPAINNSPCWVTLRPSTSCEYNTKIVTTNIPSAFITPSISASCKMTRWDRIQTIPSTASRQTERRITTGRGGIAMKSTIPAAKAKLNVSSTNGAGTAQAIRNPASGGPMKAPIICSMLHN